MKIQPLVLKGQDGTVMGKPPKGHNSASLSISVAKAKSFSKVIDLLKSAELGEKCKRNKLPWKIFWQFLYLAEQQEISYVPPFLCYFSPSTSG